MADHLEQLAKLIADIRIAMMTTQEPDGTLRSRPMATQKTEFDGNLWFFTRATSPKVEEAQAHSRVNLSYAAPDDNRYVSISGTAELVIDAAKNKELWNPALKAWFPKGLEDPDMALLKVHVQDAEYWDTPSGKMVQLVGLVKAMVSGKSYEASEDEHGKIHLG